MYSLTPDAKRIVEASEEGSAAMSDTSRSYTDMFAGSPSGDSEIGTDLRTLVTPCDVLSGRGLEIASLWVKPGLRVSAE